MTEAAQAVVDFAFGWLALNRIVSGFLPENIASGRILEKLGFVRCGQYQLPSRALKTDVTCNKLSLTRDAWAAKRV
jgi:RimJ/RimL family protein N-acetyltransferase